MKFFIGGIILAIAGLTSTGASAATVKLDYETCLNQVNELTRDFAPAEPIAQLISKLEAVLDLKKVIELSVGKNTNTGQLRYAVALENPDECDDLQEKFEKMMEENTCVARMGWMAEQPIDRPLAGDFGRFLRACYSCYLTQDVEITDI